MLSNTCSNEIEIRKAIIVRLLHISTKKTDYQEATSQSVELATEALNGLGLSLGHSFLFDQKLGTNVNCERIEKSAEACDIALAQM